MFHKIVPTTKSIPVLISSPHSGFHYPLEEEPRPKAEYLNDKVDCDHEIHQVLLPLLDSGATILYSKYSRYLIDLNRNPEDDTPLYKDGRLALGLIPEKTFAGDAIYSAEISEATKSQRTLKYHTPYHQEIKNFIHSSKKQFGRALVIELHSIYPDLNLLYQDELPDITMGTHHETSLTPDLHQTLFKTLQTMDYDVAWNKPFAGGFITRNYHDVPNNVYTLQFEINKSLYLNQNKNIDPVKLKKLQDQLVPRLQNWLETAYID